MKYCTHCGKELSDEAVICVGCGCPTQSYKPKERNSAADIGNLLNILSQRLKTNGIMWIVIGAVQILGGVFINWFVALVGVLNIISSLNEINYSKTVLEKPSGIVQKFEPIAGSAIILIYNLVIGGIIGVIGSIYYLIAIRSFVMENKEYFASFDM